MARGVSCKGHTLSRAHSRTRWANWDVGNVSYVCEVSVGLQRLCEARHSTRVWGNVVLLNIIMSCLNRTKHARSPWRVHTAPQASR